MCLINMHLFHRLTVKCVKASSRGMPRYEQLKYYMCTRLSCDPTGKRNALLMENDMSGLPGNRLNAIP